MLTARWADAKRALIGTGFFAPPDTSPMTDHRPWLRAMPDGTHDIETNRLRVETIAYTPQGNWKSNPSSCVRVSAKPVNLGGISKDCSIAILNGNADTSTELLLRAWHFFRGMFVVMPLGFSHRSELAKTDTKNSSADATNRLPIKWVHLH